MLSIIIPTYNEAKNIGGLVKYLLQHNATEVIVVDGGSTDSTTSIAIENGARVIPSPHKGRAIQMNLGASVAKEDVLYFIHADTVPPPTFIADINEAINNGFELGRYRTKFLSTHLILPINAFFTRFDWVICYGGDQTLFITKKLFASINGFSASMKIMEDYDIVIRAKQKAKYKIINKNALVSARKYVKNSWWKVQNANYCIVQMYKKGASQEAMINKYKELLN